MHYLLTLLWQALESMKTMARLYPIDCMLRWELDSLFGDFMQGLQLRGLKKTLHGAPTRNSLLGMLVAPTKLDKDC